MSQVRIVALATCHNRKQRTLSCLHDLAQQHLPIGASLTVVLVLDGCTDGTAEEVRRLFPDTEIVEGSGVLYWAGGMRWGWERSVVRKPFDHLLAFNDDVRLFPDAVSNLLACSREVDPSNGAGVIISGAFRDDRTGACSYGGFISQSRLRPLSLKAAVPNGEVQRLDTVNMNATLISASCVRANGFLNRHFKHSSADLDYGFQARRNGTIVALSKDFVGTCRSNPSIGSSREPGISPLTKLRRMHDIKEQPFGQRLRFSLRNGGPMGLLIWVGVYVKWALESVTYPFTRSRNQIQRGQ